MKNNSRTKNAIRNIIYSFGYNILVLLLGFVSRSVFLYCLSIDYLGIQGLFSDVLNMLSLADLGFGTAMTFSMYRPLAEKNYKKLAGLTTFYKRVYRIIAATITVIGLLVIPFLKYLVKLDNEIPYLRIYYLLYLANTVASYLFVYKTCIISADQKRYLIVKYNGIFDVIKTAVMTVFLLLTHNYFVYLSIQVFFTYLNNFFVAHVAEKMYPFISEPIELPKKEKNDVFKNIKSVFLYKISIVLINATDNTLISVLIGTAVVGFYSNYTMIVTKVSTIVNTFFYSLTSSLGNLIVEEGEEKRYEIYKVMQSISDIFSTFCFVCLFNLTQDFVKVWIGAQYQLSDIVLLAICLNFFFSIILLPIWVYRDATGLYKKSRFVILSTAIINILLSIFLGKRIGLVGIILATSIARFVTYFWYEPVLLFKNYFGRNCRIYFIEIGKNLIITGVLCVFVWLISKQFIVETWGGLFVKAIIIVIVSASVLTFIYYKSDGIKYIKNKIKKRSF